MDSQDKRSFFLHSGSFDVIAIVFAQCTVQSKRGGLAMASPLHILINQSLTSFLLQNGGDGRAAAPQGCWGLVGFEGWASDRSKTQRWPSHPRYVTETAWFLIACSFRSMILIIDWKILYIYIYMLYYYNFWFYLIARKIKINDKQNVLAQISHIQYEDYTVWSWGKDVKSINK